MARQAARRSSSVPASDAFEFGEEHQLLAESAARFLAERCTFAAVRQWMETPSGYDPALWRDMARLGWLGIAIPERLGGSGLGATELAIVCEQMGRRLLASPFLACTLASQLLWRAGNRRQAARWLPALAQGETLAGVALGGAEGSWEPFPVQATARPTARGYVLNGVQAQVLDCAHAQVLVAVFQLAGKPALFLLERGHLERVQHTPDILVDQTRRSCTLRFDRLAVPKSALLAADGRSALRQVHGLAWVLLAAEMAGGAEGALQLTLDYVKVRQQFGKIIGGFQALKHPLVNVMLAIENTRSLVYHAAHVHGGASKAAEIAGRMAMACACETYAHAVNRAVQFHGAIGFTWECNAQLFFRRAQWDQFAFGDALHHRRHLAPLLLD